MAFLPIIEGLLPALRSLDELIAQAIAQSHAAGVTGNDPFRGLHIGPDDVAHWLAREPGAPIFAGAGAATARANLDVLVAESLPFAWLAHTFGLGGLDLGIVIVALAPELDLRYEGLYAYLQDDVTRRRPTVDLALNLLCDSPDSKLAARSHFSVDAALLRHRLLHLIAPSGQSGAPLLTHALQLDAQVTDVLLGQGGLDRRLASFCQAIEPDTATDGVPDSAVYRRLEALFRHALSSNQPLRLYFRGTDCLGKRATAKALAQNFGMGMLCVDCALIPSSGLDVEQAIRLAFREASLRGAVIYVDSVESLRTTQQDVSYEGLVECLAGHGGVGILAGSAPWTPSRRLATGTLEVHFGMPSPTERRSCWRDALATRGLAVGDTALETLAGRFCLTPTQIADSVMAAASRAVPAGDAADAPAIMFAELAAAARAHSGHELAGLARKIEPAYGWEDIVLPDDVISELRELCGRVAQGPRVLGDWGFGRKLSQGKGANALFVGPSGTGKTMAAEVIAKDLQLDLYKIDLSGVISKYIGETEKNLDRIFGAAGNANVILFFDEADALFGKRSEVRDSHDRYANLEISYLLQKMEQYDGVAILATNLRQNLDEAFVRRLAFTVHFPFPDEAERLRIWSGVWPQATPLEGDLNFAMLAKAFTLSGGNIRNIALAAAFIAAGEASAVTHRHVLRAVQREFQKMGKSLTEAELAGGQSAVVALQERRA